MFTCSNPEDLLFPLDSPPNQHQQQQINNLQKRCLKLENDCQRYEQFLTSLKAEYEQKIRLFVDEKEREFHQLGTAHAMKLQDMENKYLQKLQNRSDDIIEYQLEIQEKSAHLLTLTHEIEALQDQREEMELRFVQKYQRLVSIFPFMLNIPHDL
jgi:glycerophosphoryl diester phosphodiesterase